MLGKIEGMRRRGATEDEIVGWYHQISGHEFQQTLVNDRKPGVVQSMGLQRIWHDLMTE